MLRKKHSKLTSKKTNNPIKIHFKKTDKRQQTLDKGDIQMANKQVSRCSASSAITELQITP
jgi:hypothetical protein